MIITLPFPPSELSGHARHHGYAHNKLVKHWRSLAWAAAIAKGRLHFPPGKAYTPEGDIHLTIRFYPPDKRGDRLNYPNRLKCCFDGLADAWQVNDARFVPHYEFHAPEAPGRVEIEIGEKHDNGSYP